MFFRSLSCVGLFSAHPHHSSSQCRNFLRNLSYVCLWAVSNSGFRFQLGVLQGRLEETVRNQDIKNPREQDIWVNKLAGLKKWNLLIVIYLFDTFFISGKQNESRARWKIASGICRKIVDPDSIVYIENSLSLLRWLQNFPECVAEITVIHQWNLMGETLLQKKEGLNQRVY